MENRYKWIFAFFSKICLWLIAFALIFIYIISSDQKLSEHFYFYRIKNQGIEAFQPIRHKYGDLYDLSHLPDFRTRDQEKEILVPPAQKEKNINLLLICDSYLFNKTKAEHFTCVNKKKEIAWSYNIDSPVKIDTLKRNILIIETAERLIRMRFAKPYLRNLPIDKKSKNQNKIVSFSGWLAPVMFNPLINQNIEFFLTDYMFLRPLKEFKAWLNYKLFKKTGQAVVSMDGQYLFFKETVDQRLRSSSFSPIRNGEIDTIVAGMNYMYEYFINQHFDEVYFSFIPNPVTILDRNRGVYNQLITKIEKHDKRQSPMISILAEFEENKDIVYQKSDSHWTTEGLQVWINKANEMILKKMNL